MLDLSAGVPQNLEFEVLGSQNLEIEVPGPPNPRPGVLVLHCSPGPNEGPGLDPDTPPEVEFTFSSFASASPA